MNKIPQKPVDSTWTDEQWQAIHASGQNVLVAAAAGSGKTAVLVTRIIEKIKQEEQGINIDELLVVTFTNASAAEMKQRIASSLEKELAVHPDSLHLKKQMALLNQASISTLHSFCLDLLRKYYYQTNIDPDFRLIDPIEGNILREEVIEEILEVEYGKEDNKSFFHLVDSLTGDRTDQVLTDVIMKLYDFSRATPSPDKWLAKVIAQYDVENFTSIKELPYYSLIKDSIDLAIHKALDSLHIGVKIAKGNAGPAPYVNVLEDDINQLQDLQIKASKSNWEELRDACINIKFKRLPTLKNKEDYDAITIEQTKKARENAKKEISKLITDWFKREEGLYLKDIQLMKPDIEELVDLVQSFSKAFFSAKQERGLLDFNDLEHLALQILSIEDKTSDQIQPSEIAKQLKKQYKEVLIDEYQDTNMVQETILRLITEEKEEQGNLFMVGDIKQSIYRFRLAEPTLFMDKYKRYSSGKDSTGLRIDLTKNFRSRSEVLDTTNFVFKQLMSKEVGEIDYDQAQQLVLGAVFGDSDHCSTELLLADMQKEERESDSLSAGELQKNQLEARLIAQKIKKLIDNKVPVYDKKTSQFRPVMYRDIVILSRAMTSATDIEEAMKDYDIPFYVNSNTGYFESTEVAVMIALLKIIDNPYQDIPLAAVLRSPIIGLNEEDLGQIRACKKNGYFYEAMKSYIETTISETANMLQAFLNQLNRFREISIRESLTGLIWQIYIETNFYEFVGGLPGGKQRQANLRALYDRADQYEKTSFRGLFRFVRFIERLELRGDDLGTAKTLGEKEDVVRMMTIHASKGLEFPIVILAGINRKFNMRDISAKVLLDKDYGFASSYVNIDKRLTYPTIMQQAVRQKKYQEMIAEEMRVLYVALTRAEEKIILVGTVPEWEKSLQSFLQVAKEEKTILPAGERIAARTYLDWLGATFIRHPQFYDELGIEDTGITKQLSTSMKLQINIIKREDIEGNAHNKTSEVIYTDLLNEAKPVPIHSDYQTEILNRLQFQYKNKSTTEIRSKQTVTELKRQFSVQDSWSDDFYLKNIQAVSLKRPHFLQKKSGLSAAEVGTAMHTVMQRLPLDQFPTEQSVKQLLDQLEKWRILSSEERQFVRINQITRFFETDLGKQVLKYQRYVKREVPFTYLIPASQVNKNAYVEDKVMIQGIVDNMIDLPDRVILIDYKTDRITNRYSGGFEEAEKIMRRRYQVQIELYREAIEAITQKPVLEAYLYFFDSQSICPFPKES